jgi:hypothetical protein
MLLDYDRRRIGEESRRFLLAPQVKMGFNTAGTFSRLLRPLAGEALGGRGSGPERTPGISKGVVTANDDSFRTALQRIHRRWPFLLDKRRT